MTYTDPFATAPANDEFTTNTEETTPVTETNAAPVATTAPEGVTLSFKGGAGYDASLLVIRAANITEMNAKLDEEGGELAALMDKAAKIQKYSTTINTPEQPAGKPSFQNGQVQYNNGGGGNGPARPDNVPAHFSYKSGNKNGKAWSGWFPPKGSDEKPIWG